MDEFEAWFDRSRIAEDYRNMLRRAFNAGAGMAMNYVADKEQAPNSVAFAGGLSVQIVRNVDGTPSLSVCRHNSQTERKA